MFSVPTVVNVLSILITNAYSAENRGDAGIILGMLADFACNPVFQGAEVTVSSQDYPSDIGKYPCRVAPSFHSVRNLISTRPFLNCTVFLVLLLPLSLLWALVFRLCKHELPFPGDLGRLLRSYSRADLVIAAGGGYLYTTSHWRGLIVLVIQLYSFYFGAILGKPVYLYSQSFGPFANRFHLWLATKFIRAARLVQAREDVSFSLLRACLPNVEVCRAVDAAFLTPCTSLPALLPARPSQMKVGVTVRNWFRNEREQHCYESVMRDFLAWLVAKYEAFVFFLPQVTCSRFGDDDGDVARAIAARLSQAHVVDDDLSAPQLKGLCGDMDFIVATRLHTTIFAISMMVPTLTISYQPKAEGILQDLGLSDFVLSIETLSFRSLVEKVEELMKRSSELRERMQALYPGLVEKARRNSRPISDDYLLQASKNFVDNSEAGRCHS
jgi:colanic acid/amylovoran biosynthesis protein